MFLFILVFLILSVNTNRAFDAGFLQLGATRARNEDTGHYGMTVCALSRVTIDYIRTVYKIDTTYLESRFNEINGQCEGNIVNDIINTLTNSQSSDINPWQFDTTVKTIASANTKTDLKEIFEKDTHFDSEDFQGGSQLILKRYQATIDSALNGDNYDQARNTFGEMLHTLQDFYSHTNFIELEYTSPSDVLAQRIFQTNEYASIDMRTCVSCEGKDCQTKSNLDENIQKNKILTSGYFIPIGINIFQRKKPKGKCSHGGTFDTTSDDEPTGGINKDNLDASHGHLHYRAANMAYQATVKVLNQLRTQIGDDKFGLFLALKNKLNSLIISIDTTYSTVNYLDLAKNLSISIVNQYDSLKYAPHNYILIAFHSSNAEVLVNSRNPNDLTAAIRTLQSSQINKSIMGEMYYHSLVEGLKKCEYASVIYTFADSSAKDGNLKYQARALLRSKQAVIYSFISERVTTNLSERDLDPLDGRDNDTDLASISGGLTFPIAAGDQSVIAVFILHRLEWTRLQSIFMCKSTATSMVFYVDPSIDELYLDILSISEIVNINQIELSMPNNSLYPLTGNSMSTKYLYMWKIVQPNAGAWRLTTPNLSPRSSYDIQLYGKSSVVCRSTLQKEMEPNTDTSDYTRLTTEPIIGSELLVLTTCDNLMFSDVNVSFINPSGNLITSYPATQTGQFGTLTRIRVPQERFRIQTIVTLINGSKIQRIEKQLISPTIFSIELRNRSRLLAPGETINMSYTITSARTDQVTVRLQIIDTLNLMDKDGVEKDLTFVNETSGIQTLTLPRNSQPKLTTDLLIFSVSRQNNQTKKFSYENDETESIYLDINSRSIRTKIHYFLISLLLLLYQMC